MRTDPSTTDLPPGLQPTLESRLLNLLDLMSRWAACPSDTRVRTLLARRIVAELHGLQALQGPWADHPAFHGAAKLWHAGWIAVLEAGAHPRSVATAREVLALRHENAVLARHLARAQAAWDVRDSGEPERLSPYEAAAHRVICQTGCIGHGEPWREQDHCRRTGQPCVLSEGPVGPAGPRDPTPFDPVPAARAPTQMAPSPTAPTPAVPAPMAPAQTTTGSGSSRMPKRS